MKRSALFIFLLLITLPFRSFGQKEDENLKELFLDAEFFFLNEDYEEALTNYMKVFRRGYAENGNINYRIGRCYLNIPGEKDKAIPYLEKATKYSDSRYEEGIFKEKHAPYDSYFFLGDAYKINNQLDKAIETYEKYKTLVNPKNTESIKLTDKEIEGCKYAAELMKNPLNFKKENLGRPISTNNRDIDPVVSGDLNSLVYISKQKFYDALFYSRKINNKWTTPVNITPEVQSDGDQYPTFLSYDGKELFLRKEDNFEADLLVSQNVDGVWKKSKSLGKNINTKYWEGNACTSKDGSTLYFSSNRKEGSGAMDIYKSVKQTNGEWGAPVNLGPVINTEFNEDCPYITEDGKRLYFISQGKKGMGGYDIFYSDIKSDGTFSEPVHLPYPINTTDDDLYFYPRMNGKIAYSALFNKGNVGFEDIYALYLTPDAEQIAMASGNGEKPAVTEAKKEVVLDTTAPVAVIQKPAEIVKPIEQPQPVREVEPPIISPKEKDKMLPKEYIISQAIFFEFNSADLTENSKKAVLYLSLLMKNYEDVKIEFVGHADAIGSEQYNLQLSQKRANAAKSYLMKLGIPSKRIIITPKGETTAIAINKNPDGSDNPEGRKFNRRVEFRLLDAKPNYNYKVETITVPEKLKAGGN